MRKRSLLSRCPMYLVLYMNRYHTVNQNVEYLLTKEIFLSDYLLRVNTGDCRVGRNHCHPLTLWQCTHSSTVQRT